MNNKERILELRRSGLEYDEIVEEVGCVKSTVSYHCNNAGLGSSVRRKLTEEKIEEMDKFYQSNSLEDTATKFGVSKTTVKKYCSKSNKSKLTPEERRKRNVEHVQRRRKKVKKMAIEYKGGSCQECGYDKCDEALDFHHKDPNEKDFAIGAKGYTRSWDKVKEELDKCVMLCSNCHREVHAGVREIS
jgi:5-methylcytosine-specific restriction endonuclease McrA